MGWEGWHVELVVLLAQTFHILSFDYFHVEEGYKALLTLIAIVLDRRAECCFLECCDSWFTGASVQSCHVFGVIRSATQTIHLGKLSFAVRSSLKHRAGKNLKSIPLPYVKSRKVQRCTAKWVQTTRNIGTAKKHLKQRQNQASCPSSEHLALTSEAFIKVH